MRRTSPRYVADGGTLLVSFFSAIVDENDAVHEGGYGAPLREALGLTVEEFLPLREGPRSTFRGWGDAQTLRRDVWQEDLAVRRRGGRRDLRRRARSRAAPRSPATRTARASGGTSARAWTPTGLRP